MKNWTDKEAISHQGIVQYFDNKSVTVSISSSTSCSGCKAEASCSLSGAVEKNVTINGNYSVKPGDKVSVLLQLSSGFAAVFLGYIFPMIVMLLTLFTLSGLDFTELFSGLASIAILIPYYLVLYAFRNRFNKKFNFLLIPEQ